MRMSAIDDLRWMIVALVCALPAAPSLALDLGTAAVPPAPPLSPIESAELGNALIFDATTLTAATPAKPLRLPSQTIQQSLDIKTT